MAASDALWNEVARIANIEFFENEQPLTGALLSQLIIQVNLWLTDEDASV